MAENGLTELNNREEVANKVEREDISKNARSKRKERSEE